MEVVRGVSDQNLQMAMHKALCEINEALGLLWLVGCSTGYRVSDLLSLRVYQACTSPLFVLEAKTGKLRTMMLPECVQRAICHHIAHQNLTDSDAFLFQGRTKGKALSRQYAHRVFKEVGAGLGLADIGTHSMRKTYAYNVLLATRSFEQVQQTLNHAYISTTFLYLIDGLTALLPKSPQFGIPPASIVASVQSEAS